MEVERLTAVLEASGLGGFQSSMAAADRAVSSTKRNLEELRVAAGVASDALNKIKLIASQAAETGASAEFMKSALGKIRDTAAEAAGALDKVRLTSAQAFESEASGELIKRNISDIGDEADKTTLKIELMNKAARGAGGGGGAPGLFGVGRGVLLPAAIGAGSLIAPEAAAAATGLLAAIPALAGAAAGAIGTVALAFSGVTKAIGGNKKAFDDLNSQQQQFVLTVRSLDGTLDKLKQTASQNLFPGLTAALKDALSPGTLNAVNTALAQFGQAIGTAGEAWGKYFGSTQFQTIFSTLSSVGANAFGKLSDAALRLFDAVGRLGQAFSPLLTWLADAADKGAKLVDAWAKAGEASGSFAGKIAPMETALTNVGNLIGALVKVIGAFGSALMPVSQTFLKDLTNGLDYLAGVIERNKQQIQAFVQGALDAAVATIKTLTPIVGDLVKALEAVVKAIGGWKTAFEIIIGGLLAAKVASLGQSFFNTGQTAVKAIGKILTSLGLIGPAAATGAAEADASVAGIGAAADASAAQVGGLRAALLSLGAGGVLAGLASLAAVLASSGSAPNVPALPKSGAAAYLAQGIASGQIPMYVMQAAIAQTGLNPNTPAGTAFKNPKFVAALEKIATEFGFLSPGSGAAGGAAADAAAKAAHGAGAAVATNFSGNPAGGISYLQQQAAAMGWTPAQVKEITNLANYEDASGKPGDKNTSFGPFQLHAGGQLPAAVWAKGPAYAQQWAWSPQGIQWALQNISQFKGQSGYTLATSLGVHQGSSNIPAEISAIYGGAGANAGSGPFTSNNVYGTPPPFTSGTGGGAKSKKAPAYKLPQSVVAAVTDAEAAFRQAMTMQTLDDVTSALKQEQSLLKQHGDTAQAAKVASQIAGYQDKFIAQFQKNLDAQAAALATAAQAEEKKAAGDATNAAAAFAKGNTGPAAAYINDEVKNLTEAQANLQKALALASGKDKAADQKEFDKVTAQLASLSGVADWIKSVGDILSQYSSRLKKLTDQATVLNNQRTAQSELQAVGYFNATQDSLTGIDQNILANLGAQKSAFEDEANALKAKLATAPAKLKAGLESQIAGLNTQLTSVTSAISQAMGTVEQDLVSALQTAQSRFQSAVGQLQSDLDSQLLTNAQNASGYTADNNTLTSMQAADSLQGYTDAVSAAQNQLTADTAAGSTATKDQIAADQKALDSANRALTEYNLQVKAAGELTKAQNTATAQTKDLNGKLADLEGQLLSGKITAGQFNDALAGLQNTFGITIDDTITPDLVAVASAAQGVESAFNSLIDWVNKQTGSNIPQVGGTAGSGTDTGGGSSPPPLPREAGDIGDSGVPATGPPNATGVPGVGTGIGAGGTGGTGSCFVAGTLVDVAGGTKPIDQLEPGEQVWLYDFAERRFVLAPVCETFRHEQKQTLQLLTDHGAVEVTAEHPFLLHQGGWVAAGELTVGDRLVRRDGRHSTVVAVTAGRVADVYNLHVDHPDHNYIASGFVVHNMKSFALGGEVFARQLAIVGEAGHEFIVPANKVPLQLHGLLRRLIQGSIGFPELLQILGDAGQLSPVASPGPILGGSMHPGPGGQPIGNPLQPVGDVTVNQYFTTSPEDPAAYAARAKFVISGIFGKGR